MQVVKHQDLREFMLGLDHEEQDTLEVLVKFHIQYVYTARIIYDPYSSCWRCISNQTTRGSVRSVAFDHRTVRAYIERDVLADLASPSTVDSFTISSNTSEEPFAAQVLNWLSD